MSGTGEGTAGGPITRGETRSHRTGWILILEVSQGSTPGGGQSKLTGVSVVWDWSQPVYPG